MTLRLRALTSVGQTLKMRALLVDAHLFRRQERKEESPKATLRVSTRFDPTELQTSEMLTKQVRAELRKRGLDAIGKPWMVRQRLEEARQAESVEALAKAIGGGSDETAKPDTLPVVDVRAKYAAKLRAAGVTGPAERDAGDAVALEAARAAIARQKESPSSKWRIGPSGMRNLLDFAAARSMGLALIARVDISDHELAELRRQVAVQFDVVQRLTTDEADAVQVVCEALGIEPYQTLAFVDDRRAARDAGRAGALSCLLASDGDNTLADRSAADHVVSSCAAVQDIINDINGTSYRAAVLTSSS